MNVPVNVLPIIFALELIFPLAVICPIIFKSSVNEIESLEPRGVIYYPVNKFRTRLGVRVSDSYVSS